MILKAKKKKLLFSFYLIRNWSLEIVIIFWNSFSLETKCSPTPPKKKKKQNARIEWAFKDF